MHQDYITPNPWSIIEEGWNPERVKSSESLFALGNGAMGQRANFEETYSGDSFQGSYIAGVYYPDKTRVGWWKNGYPEYFAKVLNAPSWIGLEITIDGEVLDLANCVKVDDFIRELDMKEGVLKRSFEATLKNQVVVSVNVIRFLSLSQDELGAIRYEIVPKNKDVKIETKSFVDSGIKNMDSNWDDQFWNTTEVSAQGNKGFVLAHTLKTMFHTCTFIQTQVQVGDNLVECLNATERELKAESYFAAQVSKGQAHVITKFGGYTVDRNHPKETLQKKANEVLQKASEIGFEGLLKAQKKAWEQIWLMSDITIKGDVKAQQGIRFNIFQLNQTYLGKDARLNIGPKGFTGEKYGGSTYWDTEAYCLPFYMCTKNQKVARNLLAYRYQHLEKAIENAAKLGFTNGAALYPMVTMNGEECHNEWEITFEEIHRNGAIAFAIFNYVRFTGDFDYIPEMGLEVLIGIARFWHQRANFSVDKDKYVILGVTGPNEYENNINNNWYTNYLAQWCIDYAVEQLKKVEEGFPEDYERVIAVTKLTDLEVSRWLKVSKNMYFPFDPKRQVYLQQDGFLDKELVPVKELAKTQRPINQKWSWDRILRSPYIKQADVLQGFYLFEDHFSMEELERHFDFYEPFTVHESSLSPCVHSIQAAKLGRMEQAYQFYLRTSRLDLDDYNKEVEEGLHITSMAGTWMSIVEGFGGMRMQDDKLNFTPQIPKEWDSYSFKVNFRNRILHVEVRQNSCSFTLDGQEEMSIRVDGKRVVLKPGQETSLNN